MKIHHYEVTWQFTVSQYKSLNRQELKRRKESMMSMAYLEAYLDWTKNNVLAQVISIRDRLIEDLKISFHGQNHVPLVVRHMQLQLESKYLGNVKYLKGCTEESKKVFDDTNLPSQVVVWTIEYPYIPPKEVTRVKIIVEDAVWKIYSGKLPRLICYIDDVNAQSKSEKDSLSGLNFLSREYESYRDQRIVFAQNFLQKVDITLHTIDLRHCGLEELPVLSCFESANDVDLSFNMIIDVCIIFKLFPAAVKLLLKNNRISKLFKEAPDCLKTIDLTGNPIRNSELPSILLLKAKNTQVYYDSYLVKKDPAFCPGYFLFPCEIIEKKMSQDQLSNESSSLMMKDMRRLALTKCNIYSLTPIIQGERLTHLFLAGNKLESLQMIENLINLKFLDCSDNKISQLKISNECINLKHLNACGNKLVSLRGAQYLVSLHELYISDNQIESRNELEFLVNLPLLALDIRNNVFSGERFRVLYIIPSLQILDGEKVTDEEVINARNLLVGLLTKEKLQENMKNNNIKQLKTLHLAACKLAHLECFKEGEFIELETLFLDNNNISDVSSLRHLRALKFLSVCGNKIDSFPQYDRIPCWQYLQELRADKNGISQIKDLYLENCPDLKTLSIRGNKLIRMEGMENVRSIRRILVDSNQIRQFEPETACYLGSLETLSISDNRLRSLSFVKSLNKLESLTAERNRVVGMNDFKSFSLKRMSLMGNPVIKYQNYRLIVIHLAPLIEEIDGVIVTEEEKAASMSMETTVWQCTPNVSVPTGKQVMKFSNVIFDGSELEFFASKKTGFRY